MGIIVHKRLFWLRLIKIRHIVVSIFIIFKCRVLFSIYESKIYINKLANLISAIRFFLETDVNQVITRK